MLKYTDVKLELLTDMDIVLTIEAAIRGGLTQASGRYGKANNKYMSDYDANLPSKFLMYYDVNNLYGAAMSDYLPKGNFRWLTSNISSFNVNEISSDSSTGYILEVDLEYPLHLQDIHKDLPYLPERLIPPGCKEYRLLTTLYDKKNYILHYKNLQQSLKAGLILKKIHRILAFDQEKWLESYIRLNTRLRTEATDSFSKELFKLMNNACFGKTMENVRNYRTVNLHTYWHGRYGARVRIASPNFQSLSIFSENFVAIQSTKLEVFMNKPIYVGMVVLDLSKTIVYKFHEQMLSLYGSNCQMLYTDTDSLIYSVTCDDIYEDIKRNIDWFDTSGYASDNQFNMPLVNKKVVGKMKDENNGQIMTEFCGLSAKMYAFMIDGKECVKKSKGVKKNVVEKTICFQDYVTCLFENTSIIREQNTIKSKLHKLYSMKQKRIALSAQDSKRNIIPGDVTKTLPFGHRDVISS